MSEVKLSQEHPIGRGKQRSVYLHPWNPDLVVKVAHPHFIKQNRERKLSHFHRLFLFRHLHDTYSEIRAQLILLAHRDVVPVQIARFRGFVDTDIGVGEMYELKKNKEGLPAPSLRQILRAGNYNEDHELALIRFLDWLWHSELTIKELHPGNLVYADIGNKLAEFVMVDGIGEKGHFALNSRFPALNRRHKRKHINKLRQKILLEGRSIGSCSFTQGRSFTP